MDAEKIVENMKAVLKKAKRRKSCHKNKSQEASNNEEDKLISELMTKNWKMKTPPINKNKDDNECDNGIVKQKVNAFEKLMSRRSNTDSPSQKVITTPETIIDSGKKVKRKYTKKIKNSLNVSGIEFDKTISADNSIQETQNSVCNGDTDEILPQLEEIENVSSNIIDSTKKRTRINDTALENSSKKRKTRDNRMQLDSNENTIENTENHLSERPKRSCVNKIDYSLFAKSPEKSPEKRNQRAKSTSKTSSKHSDSILDSPVVEPKENVKLAPLFTKKAQKFTPEITPKKEELKVPENKLLISPEKPVELNDDINKSGRPRRSCVSKIDYSQLVSPDKKSPEKKPLRQKSETENIILSPVKIEEPIIKKEEDSSLAPVFVKRSRKQNLKNQIKIDDTALDKTPDSKNAVEENNNANQPEITPSGRPNRSCKNRIDYSQLYSPDKQSPDKKINNGKSKKKDDDDIIIVDESSPVKKTKQNVKLAPLFMKKVPKPAIDPAILEARRNFLLSELPANLRATIDKQRQFEEDILSNEMVAFPKISHITQLEKDYKACYDDKTLHSKSRIRIIENDDEDSPTITKDMVMKCGLLTDCINEDYNNSVIKYNGLKKEESKAITDIKEAVRKIKDTSGTFPVNRCFKQILSKLKSAKENDEGNENGNSYLNSSFVEIFKPTNFEEILIGLEPAKSLQEFLNTWNDKSVKYDNYESDDSSSRQSMRSLNNCVVLSGKNGSGKTSSVYALANDLNYEVIEINAGSKRNGKKILQDLLEATQSHRVEKNLMDDESSLDNLQSDVVDKKTIILIEDAELTFENDDGFISSIQQLINISKRPVILTTNDSSCQHLQKFLQHNEIIYDSPKNSVTKYLSLISIATANYQIDETEIEYLYTHNRYDLRKTINEIEFFIRSESANVNSGSLMELFCDTRNKSRLQKGSQLAFHSRRDLSTLRSQSSIISDYSAMLSCSQQVLESSEISYHQHNLMNEMANFFKQSNLLKMDNRNDFAQWEPHRIISSSISDEMCSLNSSTRAKNVDYSPLLRHICRSEKSREISRRTSRSHYLRFHLSNAVNSSNEFFNTQCSIFEEANGENV